MEILQIKKIFEKFLEENPTYLHFSSANIFNAVMDTIIYGGNDEK